MSECEGEHPFSGVGGGGVCQGAWWQGGKGEEKAWNSWAESARGGRDRGFRVEGGNGRADC